MPGRRPAEAGSKRFEARPSLGRHPWQPGHHARAAEAHKILDAPAAGRHLAPVPSGAWDLLHNLAEACLNLDNVLFAQGHPSGARQHWQSALPPHPDLARRFLDGRKR